MKPQYKSRARLDRTGPGNGRWTAEIDWIAALLLAVWINALLHLLAF
ncbi:hypothetical protein [Novosphingobium sp. PC22D]|nr:hypothetical protein [Novosphingobium sp. PC22D]